MKRTKLLLFFSVFCISSILAQSKREQIEILSVRIDSLRAVLKSSDELNLLKDASIYRLKTEVDSMSNIEKNLKVTINRFEKDLRELRKDNETLIEKLGASGEELDDLKELIVIMKKENSRLKAAQDSILVANEHHRQEKIKLDSIAKYNELHNIVQGLIISATTDYSDDIFISLMYDNNTTINLVERGDVKKTTCGNIIVRVKNTESDDLGDDHMLNPLLINKKVEIKWENDNTFDDSGTMFTVKRVVSIKLIE